MFKNKIHFGIVCTLLLAVQVPSYAQILELFVAGSKLLNAGNDGFENLKQRSDGSFEIPQKHADMFTSVFFSQKEILRARMQQSRKFQTKDTKVIIENIDSTLKDIGFINHNHFDGMGTAGGDTYSLTYYIRETPSGVIMRALIRNAKTQAIANATEYKNFWNGLSKNKFLTNLDIDPKDIE